jgi:hypothetical protein
MERKFFDPFFKKGLLAVVRFQKTNAGVAIRIYVEDIDDIAGASTLEGDAAEAAASCRIEQDDAVGPAAGQDDGQAIAVGAHTRDMRACRFVYQATGYGMRRRAAHAVDDGRGDDADADDDQHAHSNDQDEKSAHFLGEAPM